MHELGITRNIVAICAEKAGGCPVQRVCVEVGRHAPVLPEALRFCFDVVSRGTLLEGATLEIVEVRGRARCRCCGAEFSFDDAVARCACGSHALERLAGEELRIREMELAV